LNLDGFGRLRACGDDHRLAKRYSFRHEPAPERVFGSIALDSELDHALGVLAEKLLERGST